MSHQVSNAGTAPALDRPTGPLPRPPVVDPAQDNPMPRRRDRHPDLKRRLVLSDIAAGAVGWGVALAVPVLAADAWTAAVTDRLAWAAIAVAATLAGIVLQDLHLARVCVVRWMEIQGLARSVVGGGIALVVAEQTLGGDVPLREVTAAAVAAFVALACTRGVYQGWLRRQRAAGRFVRDVILVGADDDAVQLADVMREHPELGFRPAGYVGAPGYDEVLGAPWLGGVERAAAAVTATGSAGALVVASALPPGVLNDVVRDLLAHDIRVQLSSGLRGIAQQRFRATPLAYEPLFYIEPISLSSWQWTVKRVVDVAGSVLGLVVCAPLFALIALAVKLDSPGPVLFRQQRVGRDGAPFTMLKFRTMTTDAEARRDLLLAGNERSGGPLFKMASDPRITRVGRLLRASSLDELPQLVNVLTGAMSLVGPRPALPSEVAQFDERLRMRARVTPGMTGLWQIEARDNPAFGPYRRLDLFYVENWSPLLDVEIIVATVFHLVGRTLRHLRDVVGGRAGRGAVRTDGAVPAAAEPVHTEPVPAVLPDAEPAERPALVLVRRGQA